MQSTKEHVRKKCLAEMATSPNAPLNASTNSLANSHKLARAPLTYTTFQLSVGRKLRLLHFWLRPPQASLSFGPSSKHRLNCEYTLLENGQFDMSRTGCQFVMSTD